MEGACWVESLWGGGEGLWGEGLGELMGESAVIG